MPTNKAVVDVVESWSGQRPERMSQNLEEWWGQTAPGSPHSTLDFDPQGIEDLISRLQRAFPLSPTFEDGDFEKNGNVKTVQDLVDSLQPPMADEEKALSLSDAGPGKRMAVASGRLKKQTSRKSSPQRATPKKRIRSAKKTTKSGARTPKKQRGKKRRKAR